MNKVEHYISAQALDRQSVLTDIHSIIVREDYLKKKKTKSKD